MKPIDMAEKFIGERELPGEDHNSLIVAMLDRAGCDWADDDETPWCSAFVYWCCDLTNYPVPITRKLMARSWLTLPGSKLRSTHPTDILRGDIVVFSRGEVGEYDEEGGFDQEFFRLPGHVGFAAEDYKFGAGVVQVLGGNQSNRVRVLGYPDADLLGVVPLSE